MRYLLLFMFTLSSSLVAAQAIEDNVEVIDSLDSKVKRISLGVKIGVPNIAGLSLEGVTPLLDNRIAPYFDYSSFDINPDEVEVGLSYSEFGVNIYLGNKGKGAYAGIGFGSLNTDLTFTNVTLSDDNGNSGSGTVSVNEKLSTTNLKLGIKTGGRIYFRLEVGYGFGTIPSDIELRGTFSYPDPNGNGQITGQGTDTEEFPTIPGVGTNGILIGNFGFGISF